MEHGPIGMDVVGWWPSEWLAFLLIVVHPLSQVVGGGRELGLGSGLDTPPPIPPSSRLVGVGGVCGHPTSSLDGYWVWSNLGSPY